MSPRRSTICILVIAAISLSIPGCEAAKKWLPAVAGFASNVLNVAETNHGGNYAGKVQGLLKSFLDLRDMYKDHKAKRSGQQPGAQGGLAVDVAMVKLAGANPPAMPMSDGDALGTDTGDVFQLSFQPNQDCYVYVVLIDPTGMVQPLRGARGDARAAGGQTVNLPGAGQAYKPDQNRGVETIYVVAALRPSPEIEGLLQEFASQTQSRSVPTDYVTRPAVVPDGFDGKRQQKSKVRTRSGDEEVDAEQYFREAGADLVITRWFNHE